MSKSTAGGAGGGVGRRSAQTFTEVQDDIDAERLGDAISAAWEYSLTQDEVRALNKYQNAGSNWRDANNSLRGKIPAPEMPDTPTVIANLDSALDRASLPQGLILWRQAVIPDIVPGDNPQALVGRRFQDKGFTSTSMIQQQTFAGRAAGSVFYKIQAPKGTKGQYIEHTSKAHGFMTEREVLLHRGHVFEITKYLGLHQYEKKHMYELRIVGREP